MRIEIGKRDSRYINAHICYFSFKYSKKKKNSNDENKNKNRKNNRYINRM